MLNTYLVNEHYLNYMPTAIVHVYTHTIYNGKYGSVAYPINTFYLISADSDGNQIISEGSVSNESRESGQRISFKYVPEINNSTDLDTLVVSMKAQQRLMSKYGAIMIPWNCGQELYDVITITDSPCNQSDATHRVMGIRTSCDVKTVTYVQYLRLGAL